MLASGASDLGSNPNGVNNRPKKAFILLCAFSKYMQREYLFVITSGLLSGLIVFGGQIFSYLGLSLFEISFLLYIFTIPLLLPFVLLRKQSRFKKEMLPIWILFGLSTAFAILAQFGALVLGVQVAVVVLLLYTQPLWTILFSKFFLKENVGKIEAIACALVIGGTVFLVNPFAITSNNWIGLLVALMGGICLSAWVITGSIASKKKADPIATKFFASSFMLAFLFVFFFLLGFFIKDPKIVSFSLNWPIQIWFYILLFNVFAETINHLCYLKGVEKVLTADAGIILLLEPVVGALLAVIFLGQMLTTPIIVGGALILIANYLVITKENKK